MAIKTEREESFVLFIWATFDCVALFCVLRFLIVLVWFPVRVPVQVIDWKDLSP